MKKIKKDKILLFTSQLNSLLKSGITFSNSLNILILAEDDKNFKEILKKIYRNLNNGKSIFESFKNFKNIFGDTFLYMLKVGELSGNLTSSFDSVCLYLEYNLENKRKVVSLLIYPIIVLTITLIILSFILLFILPNFISIFEENEVSLPSITRFLLFISDNFFVIIAILSSILLIFNFVLKYINSQNKLKLKKDRFILNIFIFGTFLKLSLAEEVYYSLYTFLNSGISLIEGIEIISSNTKNLYIKNNLDRARKELLTGQNISNSLKYLKLFNIRFQSFIQTGEESGFLAETFLEISKILRKEYEYKTKKYIALIEPFSIVFLGGIITIIVLAIYLPIFSIADIF